MDMQFNFSLRTTFRTSLEDVIESNVLVTVTSHNIAKSRNEQTPTVMQRTRGNEFFSMLLLPTLVKVHFQFSNQTMRSLLVITSSILQ